MNEWMSNIGYLKNQQQMPHLFGFLYYRYAAFAVCVDTYYGPITYIMNTL